MSGRPWANDLAGALYPLALAVRHAAFNLAAGAVETVSEVLRSAYAATSALHSELWQQAGRAAIDRQNHRSLQMMFDKRVAMAVAEAVAQLDVIAPSAPDEKKSVN